MSCNRRNVVILGATGSIGVATAEVLGHLQKIQPDHHWRLAAASGHRNIEKLDEVLSSFRQDDPRPLISCHEAAAGSPGRRLLEKHQNAADDSHAGVGSEAMVAAAEHPDTDIVVASIVGRAGLESTMAAVKAGKRVALANKETLVVAGHLVRPMAAESGCELLPVDSEHSAVFQALGCPDPKGGCQLPAGVEKVILTASGGPFRNWSKERMQSATIDDALAHPTWDMGRKITIDSATMLNKALEIIEAKWLFDIPADKIEVVVHPQSFVHSMVQFQDGSVIAQMSPPDMRMPIQYALTYPDRVPGIADQFDPGQSLEMTYQAADLDRFPALGLGFEVAKRGGSTGAVLNAAGEAAVGLFLEAKIRFTDIAAGCRAVLDHHPFDPHPDLNELTQLDRWARAELVKWASQR